MTALTYGMQLPVQTKSISTAQPWEDAAGPAEIGEVARACDRSGFGFVGVCDHIAIPRDRAETMKTTWYDTVATLGWIAGQTSHVRLLSHVYILAYRHPLVTAKAFATLDALSGGRAVLGVGAGHVEPEFDVLGIPFHERGRRTDEALPLLRAALRDEWAAGDMGQQPRPAQPDGVPIWVGGSTMPAFRRAARFGDGWLPQGPPEGGMTGAIATITRLREEAGRADEPFAVGGRLSFHVGTPDRELPPHVATGTPEQLAEKAMEHAGIGVTHLFVQPVSRSCAEHVEQIEAWGREVAPLVV